MPSREEDGENAREDGERAERERRDDARIPVPPAREQPCAEKQLGKTM
jgi:hypothetical protein